MILLVLAACAGSDPADPPDTDAPDTDTVALGTGSTGDTGPFAGPAATVTVTQRVELVTAATFSIDLVGAATATLDCVSDDDPLERHIATVGDGDNELHGMLADTTFHCQLVARGTLVWADDVVTGPLPDGLPELALSVDGAADFSSGYLVTNHWGGDGPNVQRGLIVDGDGRIRWYQAFDDATSGGLTVSWRAGDLIAGGGRGLIPGLFGLGGTKTFEVGPPPEGRTHHHECRRTPQGYIVGLSGGEVPRADTEGFRVEVTDPTDGHIVWDYDAGEGIEAGDWQDLPRDSDPFHPNAVLYLDDELGPAVWVSLRRTDELARIDRNTERVSFRMGPWRTTFALLDATGAPLGQENWFFGQHAPELYGNRLFIMDNGSGRTDGTKRSRAVEYRIDLTARTVTQVWEWSEDGWYDPYFGSVKLLTSGHVLVAAGHSKEVEGSGGPTRTAFILEVDPTTNEVLRRLDFTDSRDSLFRAQLVDGCDLFANVRYCPELAE